MEFYQKLQKLRKENGMSQEELAGHLNVSRQAVSKWENNQGFPETDKLLAISNLFNVSLDYLLKTETPAAENGEDAAGPGYYASREAVDGYLAFRRRGARQMALGVAIIILSVAAPISFQSSNESQAALGGILMLLIVALGVAILVASAFRPNRYTELETQPLVFDPAVLRELETRYLPIRRRNGIMVVAGILLLFLAVILTAVLGTVTSLPEHRYLFVFPVLVAAGVAILMLAVSSMNAYTLFLKNAEHVQEVKDGKKYGWLWATTMPLAAMIFLGAGLIWGAWRVAWLILPVLAILTMGIMEFMKARADAK